MKKGFTLTELLAVIVILAIIAVIATPIVLNIIKNSKESASLRSADFYLDALKLAIETKILEDTQFSLQDGVYHITKDGHLCLGNYFNDICDSNILKVEVDGSTAKRGLVYINSNKISKVINLEIGENIFALNDNGLVISSGNYSVWDGQSFTKLKKLDINEDLKIVKVNTAADLAGVRNAINSGELTNYNIVLNSSIDLNENLWEPIGISASNILKEGDQPFTGTFDGNGYIVKGLKIEQLDVSRSVGFFGTVFGDVTIKNLNLEGSLNSNFATAGGLIGVVLDNGDIVPNAIIENCNLNVDVTSADGTGGFIGRSFNTGTVTITNSTNNGTITSTTKASGFVAFNSGSTLTINNSINNGNVTGGTLIGGFIGYADKGQNILIKESINNGNITTKSTSGTAGGIVGNITEALSGNKHNGTFEKCINNGVITGAAFAGGLIGGSEGEWLLLDSINNGKVIGINNANAGGIIGLAKYNITIDNTKNTAEVTGTSAVGGIIGRYELQKLHSQYETYTAVIRNSSGGTKELLTGTARTKGGVIAYQRVKADYKDLVTITIENSSMNGVKDIALGG